MSDTTDLDTPNSLAKAHPWHGVDPSAATDGVVVYIENAPLAKMKYEVDLGSGILKVDHPHQSSALPPAAYGFIPRTLCGSRVAQLNSRLRGDRAALDVFVLSESPIEVPGVLAEVRLIGGVPVKDESYVDDKLLAVLLRDSMYGLIQDITEVAVPVVDRICHYLLQESLVGSTEVGDPFGHERARLLFEAGLEDYAGKFGQ